MIDTPCAHGRLGRCGQCEEEAWTIARRGSIALWKSHIFVEQIENETGADYWRVAVYPPDEPTARRIFSAALAAAKEPQ